MSADPSVFSQLSTPDLEAYVEGRFDKMTDAGKELAGVALPPVMPMPGVMGTSPSRPLQPPSGGMIDPRQAYEFGVEHGIPLAAQTGGAMLGGVLPPPLNIPASILLSGLGNTYGTDLSNYLLGRQPQDMVQRAETMGWGMAGEVGGQALTRGVAAGARGALGIPSAETSAVTREGLSLAEKYGVNLSGGQVTGSPAMAAIEQIPTRFPIGANPVVKFGEEQRAAAAGAVRGLQDQLGGAPVSLAQTGKDVGAALTSKAKSAKAILDDAYLQAEQAAGGATILGNARREAAMAYLEKEGLVAPGLQNKTGVRSAKAAAEGRGRTPDEKALEAKAAELSATKAAIDAKPYETLRQVLREQLPDLDKDLGDILERLAEPRPMSYAQTRDLELRLGDEISKLQRAGKKHQAGQLIEIRQAIRTDIKVAAAAMGGDFAEKLAAADKYAADVYFKDFGAKEFPAELRKAAQEHPELVLSKLLNSDSEGINQIKRVLSQNAPQWKKIQSQVIEELAATSHASVEETGGRVGQLFSVSKWLSQTEGPHSQYRMDRLKEILDPATFEGVQELNKLFHVIQKGGSTFYGANNSGTAAGLLSVAQLQAVLGGGGVLGGAYYGIQGDEKRAGAALGTAALAVTAPALMAKTLLAPGIRDIIARGTLQAKGAAAKAARITGAAVRTGARMSTDPLEGASATIPPMNPAP